MLTEKQFRQFHEEGYVSLGQVASDAEIEGLRTRMDDIMSVKTGEGFPVVFGQGALQAA